MLRRGPGGALRETLVSVLALVLTRSARRPQLLDQLLRLAELALGAARDVRLSRGGEGGGGASDTAVQAAWVLCVTPLTGLQLAGQHVLRVAVHLQQLEGTANHNNTLYVTLYNLRSPPPARA